MQWTNLTHLTPLNDEPGLDDAGQKLRQQLNKEIAAILADRVKLIDAAEQLETAELENLTPTQIDGAKKARVKFDECLRRELALRDRIAGSEWAPVLRAARVAWRDEAMAKYRQAQDTVRGALLEIGYVDGTIPGGNVLSIIPDMIERHPHVFSSRNEARAAEARAGSFDDLKANDAVRDAIREQLRASVKHRIDAA